MESLLFSPILKTFSLIFLAEMGDKSQLVCMSLAARHRIWPVISGAVLAFALLNLLGVTLGSLVAAAVPEWLVLLLVTLAFLLFGVQALREAGEEEQETASGIGRSLLLSTFALIFVAEFGDKTQLAVAALGGMESALQVWLGATFALLATSLLGVLVGKTLLRRVSIAAIQRGSGLLFIGFALFSGVELAQLVYS